MEWILCKDRLPEEDGEYLVTTCYGRVTSMTYATAWNCHRKEDGTVFDTYKAEPGTIIAWTPMPAPYVEPEIIWEDLDDDEHS